MNKENSFAIRYRLLALKQSSKEVQVRMANRTNSRIMLSTFPLSPFESTFQRNLRLVYNLDLDLAKEFQPIVDFVHSCEYITSNYLEKVIKLVDTQLETYDTLESLLLRRKVIIKTLKQKKLFLTGLCALLWELQYNNFITEEESGEISYLIEKFSIDNNLKSKRRYYIWTCGDWNVRRKWLLTQLEETTQKLKNYDY